LRERKERKYQEQSKLAWRKLSDEQYASAQIVNGDLEEERVTTERLRATLEGAKIVQNFLMETVIDLVDEVGDLEEEDLEGCLEEVEEELDDMEESANEALAGWAQADALSETTLAWGTRVVDLLERAEREGRR
ncbi:hypothetical protein LCGC14_2103120, partial [marine sediment metagenome]